MRLVEILTQRLNEMNIKTSLHEMYGVYIIELDKTGYKRQELKELEQLETKMRALEGAGVDNWEGYEIAMEDIEAQEKIDNTINDAVEKVVKILQESAFEPSERGAGFASTEEAQEDVFVILTKCLNELRP